MNFKHVVGGTGARTDVLTIRLPEPARRLLFLLLSAARCQPAFVGEPSLCRLLRTSVEHWYYRSTGFVLEPEPVTMRIGHFRPFQDRQLDVTGCVPFRHCC